MLSSHRYVIVGFALLCAVLTVAPAAAQVRRKVTRAPAELLAAYARESQTPETPSSASHDLISVLTYHGDYAAADVEALLRGLEQVALSGTPSRLRAEAAFELSIPGSQRAVHPIPGTFARLERVYRRSTDPLVRSVLVGVMGDLIEQHEAAAFLERIVKQEPADFAGAESKAVQSLLRMGDEGRAVLKRLHETGAVRDPEAKLTLVYLAKHDFRRPP